MFVKKIDENTIEVAPNVLFDEKKVYANPTEETLLRFGYFPLIETQMPTKEGYYYTYHYELDGETVVKVWDEHEVPPEPEPAVEEETLVENVSDDAESGQENVQDEENEQEITEPTESENESQE